MTDAGEAGPPPIVPGVARALSPLVRRIALDLHGEAGANTYLVGIDEIAVIDPGPDRGEHLDAVAGCGGDRIRWILVTGSADSSGAERLAAMSGAEVASIEGLEPCGSGPGLAPGDTLVGTEFRLTLVPGAGLGEPRACFLLQEERVLFSGDYLDPVRALEAEDRAEYLATLARLRRMRLRAIAPASGQLIEDPLELLDRVAPG